MKTLTKSIILIAMAAVLAVLIIIPVDLSAITKIKGTKWNDDGVDSCVCPGNGDCQCILIEPQTDN
ncbi:MAG: hypothetical protein EHM45_22455 [Desulfobacteraceae bacterium]|nr:MAG: hypothetical protein EHM45_22455 [Desulfobacteraceae bacterium]